MMIEGSGSKAGSGSIPLTSGSGSGRPKNTWIRWIRIRNIGCRELVLCGTGTEFFKSVFCTGTRETILISFLISMRKDLKGLSHEIDFKNVDKNLQN
jgi:hypothetical protein